jgi:hypothetical protein
MGLLRYAELQRKLSPEETDRVKHLSSFRIQATLRFVACNPSSARLNRPAAVRVGGSCGYSLFLPTFSEYKSKGLKLFDIFFHIYLPFTLYLTTFSVSHTV